MMQRALVGILLSTILSACANHTPMAEPSVNPYYTVQPGDNLDSIAFFLEVPATLLIRVNPSIDPDNLTTGSRLIVPGAQTRRQANNSKSDNSIQNATYIWPVSNIDVSSPFGYRSGRLHSGIDLRAPRGTPIKASSHGKVIYSGRKNGYGNIIIIAHAGGIETAYGHNSRNLVKAGQRVEKGRVIAKVGRTGNATGNHVHFELRRRGKAINPKRYLPAIH
jgi:murein DD-endopeptidase MepM/ murein hydrolase activator NlpD